MAKKSVLELAGLLSPKEAEEIKKHIRESRKRTEERMKSMNLSSEIKKIKERNLRVEADKAWELSGTRKAIIAVMTYVVIVLIFLSLNAPRPWTSALIPTVGFFLSTGSLPFFKKLWLEKIYTKENK